MPLTAVVSLREETAPLQIGHLGQFPAATVSFNLAPGVSLGEAVDVIKKAEDDIGLPASMLTNFQGAALGGNCESEGGC